jgi:hypothetical protein
MGSGVCLEASTLSLPTDTGTSDFDFSGDGNGFASSTFGASTYKRKESAFLRND